jgi:hypothetical protein
MGVLDDGIAVFLGLAWNLLSLSDSDVLYETAFEVLLEELPVSVNVVDVVRHYWRDPN